MTFQIITIYVMCNRGGGGRINVYLGRVVDAWTKCLPYIRLVCKKYFENKKYSEKT